MSAPGDPSQVVLITGSGRSGTTWLGEMMRSHTACTYKYEPFPEYKASPYHAWVERLPTADPGDLRDDFNAMVRRGYIDIDRPPFISDTLRGPRAVLPLVYKLGCRVPGFDRVFTGLARFDITGAPVVLKDVWLPNVRLPRLVDVLDPHIVTIVRHPYASVASALKGIDMGIFAGEIAGKHARIRTLAEGFADFADPDGLLDRLPDLNPTEIEALRWRLEAEPTAAFVSDLAKGRIVVYERLVERPLDELAAVFADLGWTLGPETRDFIAQSRTSDTNGGKAQYYSTNRAPSEALEGWRDTITESQRADIERVCKPSPLLELWD